MYVYSVCRITVIINHAIVIFSIYILLLNKLFVICNVVRVIRGDRNTDKKVFRSIICPTYAENRSVGYYFSPAFFNKYSFEPRDPFENRTY